MEWKRDFKISKKKKEKGKHAPSDVRLISLSHIRCLAIESAAAAAAGQVAQAKKAGSVSHSFRCSSFPVAFATGIMMGDRMRETYTDGRQTRGG